MKKQVQIVDRGRGPQLSTSRITVQDVVPYFKRNCTHEQIIEAMPNLTLEEVQALEHYVKENYAAVMEEDSRLHAYTEEQIRLQKLRFPDEAPGQRLARMKELLAQRRQEKNGAADSR